jgi:hypothetical protein
MQPTRSVPIPLWWLAWAAVIVGLAIVHAMAPVEREQAGGVSLRYLPVAPLVFSAIIRWLVLPRFRSRLRAFPIFVFGVAMAEGCGLLGIFLAPDLRQTYLALAFVGLGQFVPVFASRYDD